MAEAAYPLVRGDFEKNVTIEDIRIRAEKFAIERKWIDYHTPRNLALATVGEVRYVLHAATSALSDSAFKSRRLEN